MEVITMESRVRIPAHGETGFHHRIRGGSRQTGRGSPETDGGRFRN